MIVIKKNSLNRYKIDIDTYDYYLLEYTNTYDCSSFTSVHDNTSIDCSFPTFEIEEVCVDDVDVLNGKVNLGYVGYWSVAIYGNINNTNLDVNLATFLEEEDSLVYVNGCDSCGQC